MFRDTLSVTYFTNCVNTETSYSRINDVDHIIEEILNRLDKETEIT
jgi:hypothetical protein